MNQWITRDGGRIQIKDMKLGHVENTLKMLVKKYTLFCINHGARHACSINVDKMEESKKREMMNMICADRTYLKRLVSTDCFGYDVYSELVFPE